MMVIEAVTPEGQTTLGIQSREELLTELFTTEKQIVKLEGSIESLKGSIKEAQGSIKTWEEKKRVIMGRIEAGQLTIHATFESPAELEDDESPSDDELDQYDGELEDDEPVTDETRLLTGTIVDEAGDNADTEEADEVVDESC